MSNLIKRIYYQMVPWRDSSKKILRIYKKMDTAYKKGNKFLAGYYCFKIEKKYHCRICPGAKIGSGFFLAHSNGVIIGGEVEIGKNVSVYQQVTIGRNREGYPVIGDNVIIYAGAKIIGGVKIGNNCIIGANAVVTKSFPDNSIVGGVPAKMIKKRNPEDKYI